MSNTQSMSVRLLTKQTITSAIFFIKVTYKMFRVLQMLKNPPLHDSPKRQYYEFDTFWSLYMCYINATHKGNSSTSNLLRNEYERTIYSLFNSYTLCNKDLSVVSDTLTYQISEDVAQIQFYPLHVMSADIKTTQCDCCLILANIWLQAQIVDIVIDLSALTTSMLYLLMKKASGVDIRNGISLWNVLPCTIKSITVIEPKNLHGWGVLKRAIGVFISKKLQSRCKFQSE